jgi:hypothetical protein
MVTDEVETPPQVDDLVVAVRALDKAYSHWVKHSKDDDFPPSLIKTIGVIGVLVTAGFPKDDRLVQLYMACCTLAGAYQEVISETPGSERKLLAGIETVVKFLDAHEQEEDAPPQSVASMLKEYGSASQRYVWIARAYGEYDADEDMWNGPFFNRHGIPNEGLIEKEGKNPGSVLGENYQPSSQKIKMARLKAAALKQLAGLQAGLFRPEGGAKPEKATVLEMLQDGQYADVISRVKKVPLDDVLKVAKENGIPIVSRDAVLSAAAVENDVNPIAEARGYVKPQFTEEEPFDDYDDDAEESFDVDTTVSDPMDEIDSMPQPVSEKMTSEELSEFALQMLAEDSETTAHEILAAAVTKTGKTASRQMLAPILKKLQGV